MNLLNLKLFLKSHDWFRSYGHAKWGIANGLILLIGGCSLCSLYDKKFSTPDEEKSDEFSGMY